MKRILAKLVALTLIAQIVACASGVMDRSRTYARTVATGPLRVLSSNPRYFTDGSGRAVYLTGSHYWWNLQDGGRSFPPPAFAFDAYLDFLNRYNHNFIRLWTVEQARWVPSTRDDFYVDISPYIRPGPGLALDGKPRFDLTNFEQAYFDRLRSRVVAARERGIYVSVMLFNGWSVEPFEDLNLNGNPWRGHPFHGQNNINGIDGDINDDDQGQEIHTMGADPRLIAIRARQEAYIRKVIDSVNDLDNVLYEIGNELVEASTDWQYHMILHIKEYESGQPRQHPVGMTYQGMQGGVIPNNKTLTNSPADWISPGDNESLPDGGYREAPPAADGQKVILSDTDHLWGIGGDTDWVWKSFTRGLNPIYMDPYNDQYHPPVDDSVRMAMGHTLTYANRINLAVMTPRPDLASTGYCLAQPGREYLIYVPSGRETSEIFEAHETVTIDLSSASVQFHMEWFSPKTGKTVAAGMTTGGSRQEFTAPFSGEAVLYLSSRASSS